jgi:hypothetical protein
MLTTLSLRRRSDGDEGWAMIMVIGSVFIMTILGVAALAVVLNGMSTSRRDQSWQAALQAADAGIDDYVARLQLDPNYWTQGNNDPSNTAMSGWRNVPGAGGESQMHYVVDNSNTSNSGYIKLTSQGRVRNTTRTVSVTLAKENFLDYMYFTRFETIDPVAYTAAQDPNNQASTVCAKHAYAPDNRPDPGQNVYCQPIYFQSADVLKGPVHSEDKIRFNGSPTFQDEFSTEWQDPAGKYYTCISACNPTFAKPPMWSSVPFPHTNVSLRQWADPTQGGSGCIFKGPTSIVFGYAGGVSSITVKSPETPSNVSTGACGTHDWSVAQTVPAPNGQVIYVDGYTGNCNAMPAIGYPVAGDANSALNPVKLAPNCHNGDAYVQGWVKGQFTIGTANNIIVTDDIRYVGTNTTTTPASLSTGIPTSSANSPSTKDTQGSDLLGLSASNFVEIYHPMKNCSVSSGVADCSADVSVANPGGGPAYPFTNIQVDAALVASADSVLNQNWDTGPDQGVYTIVGGMIQQFRGPVGTSGGTGFDKDYNYDSRLKTLTPPHLADLASSAWNVVSYGENGG